MIAHLKHRFKFGVWYTFCVPGNYFAWFIAGFLAIVACVCAIIAGVCAILAALIFLYLIAHLAMAAPNLGWVCVLGWVALGCGFAYLCIAVGKDLLET